MEYNIWNIIYGVYIGIQMKKNNHIKSFIFLSAIFSIVIIFNYLYKNITMEAFTGFDWSDFQNQTSNNKKNLIGPYRNIPVSYFPNSNSICSFPDCNTFSGVENNWNQRIVKTRNNVEENNVKSSKPIDNYRVVTGPYDFLRFNISSPNCCQYTQDYTNGTGCICLTQQQRQILNSRGGNRR